MPDTTYYLIRDKIVGKRENCDACYRDYLFRDGRWEPDDKSVIMDHLMGYDPYEPDDSPYKVGSTSVMDEMEEIPEGRALALVGGQATAHGTDGAS